MEVQERECQMRGSRKQSKKVLFAVIACMLCGCQRSEDMGAQTESEIELRQEVESEESQKSWEAVNGEESQKSGESGNEESQKLWEAVNGEEQEPQESENEKAQQSWESVKATENANTSDGDSDINGNDKFLTNREEAFYYTELSEELKARITGKSYPDTEEAVQISYEDLAYVHVLHYDFNMEVQEGELICNQAIAQDLTEIFYELYESGYLIEKICLIDVYDADDEASMADNNTSCFNYRTVPGRTKLSNHAYGYAIDINPLYNPYVRTRDGQMLVSPDNAGPYVDRSADFAHKIDRDDVCYQIFTEHGFDWGGAWKSSKDYQHFEKVP